MDYSAKILDKPFTIGWLEETLLNSFNLSQSDSKVTNLSAKKVGLGQGFCSDIINVDLEWSESEKMPKSVILKIPNMDAAKKASGDLSFLDKWIQVSHVNECNAYEVLVNIPNLAVPKCYFTRNISQDKPGIIVMESFADRAGFPKVLTGLTLPQVFQVVDNLSRIHCYCLQNPSFLDRFYYDNNPKQTGLMEVIPHVQKILDEWPQYRNLLDPVQSYFTDPAKTVDLSKNCHKMLGLPPVLVHEDMWSNNLIFELKDGVVSDHLLAIVDWQTCRVGCLANDIARLLVASCTTELRKNHKDEILEFYYSKLSTYLGHEPPFGLEVVKRAYDYMLPIGMFWMLLSIHFWNHGAAYEMEGGDKRTNTKRALKKCKEVIDDVVALNLG